MPISSSAATVEKKKAFKLQNQVKSVEHNVPHTSEKTLLKIAPALPIRDKRNLYVRSHSALNPTSLSKLHDPSIFSEPVPLCSHSDGLVHISRLQEEKEAQPDRISLDRRGLTSIPIIDGEPNLRLLSMQHNLVNSLEVFSKQLFPSLVFLDIYDNQLEQMQSLDKLENLRVLLIGKNRIKKIEGLESLSKIEVLDLHGNQITQVGGLSNLTELKVLNLAGNQIRVIGAKDLLGLQSLQELNLRRNRLKKLLGFAEVPNLSKLFISNNDLQWEFLPKPAETMDIVAKNGCGTETSSILSVTSNVSIPSNSGSENSSNKSITRNVRSAVHGKSVVPRCNVRAATAKTKKQSSPALSKDREQGGDYLIEICGRHLNVYGQGALRFIDKPWNISKAHDVNTVKFNYINFNSISGVLNKFKHRFPNVDNLIFKETNITCLGQLNALAEVQGLTSLFIDPGGNPICEKNWQSYAIYRLAHWGLKNLNNEEVTENDIKLANEEYKSLSDLVLWSLPDILLQPLLVRLRIDVNHGVTEQNAKKWLLAADPELRSVVSKEALQWKKGSVSQEDTTMRHKGKQHISDLLEEMANAMNKLVVLEQQWQTILHSFVQNTLLDYSQLDLYMKQKIQDMNK